MRELRKEIIALGRQRYYAAREDLQLACERFTERDAEAAGMTLEELREVTLDRHIATTARANSADVSEMLIILGSDDHEEAQALLDDMRAEIRRAIGAA